MKGKWILIFLITIGISCSDLPKDNNGVYYVIEHKTYKESDSIPPLIERFYGNFNFVLFDSTRLYFHNKSVMYFCGTDIDFTKPPKLFLKTENVIKIDLDSLPIFLKTNIPDSIANDYWFSASISSPNDTIRNKGYKIITDFFKSKNVLRLNVKNWTEEEQFVVTAKVANLKYNADSIKWIIGFDREFQFDSHLR